MTPSSTPINSLHIFTETGSDTRTRVRAKRVWLPRLAPTGNYHSELGKFSAFFGCRNLPGLLLLGDIAIDLVG